MADTTSSADARLPAVGTTGLDRVQ